VTDTADPVQLDPAEAPRPAPRARSRRWLGPVLIAAPFVVAIIAFVVSSAIPKTYSASALVRVTVFAPSGPTDTTVSAENGIAAQYALLATTPPVLRGAARVLGQAESTVTDAVSAGTDSGRNLITVRATGSDEDAVQAQANAVADQLVRVANASGSQAAARFSAEIDSQTRSLDETINQYRKLISEGPASLRASRAQALSALLSERQRQRGTTVSSSVASAPSLEVWSRAGRGATDGPGALLYALMGFVVTAAIAGYGAYLAAINRRQVV
jgi:hypothetical protein